ncbi:MAG: T9SS type A sorting domain-containing protein, partial [Ignavibacteriales bacterium]|nr:T9SS type A sorting domain-containing protein [Ignavibacteriales bacterium]
ITSIEYQLPFTGRVTLNVSNVLGQVVTTLVDEVQQAGFKSATWNVNNTPSGVYYYRLEATSVSDPRKYFTQIRKMVIIK